MGITKCTKRAPEALFWPGMTTDFENTVNDCTECSAYQNKQQKEPLRPTITPDRPWAKAGVDLFEFGGHQYPLTIDYYSKYIEVDRLRDQSSRETIAALKAQFCRHGFPDVLRSDNGPQFSSEEFASFCAEWGMEYRTSSPAFPQSNGDDERGVQTVKRMWRKTRDKQVALLDYRTTPLETCGLSPAMLPMCRRPRNKLPTPKELLNPVAIDHAEVKRCLDQDKARQKHYYDRGSQDLHSISPRDPVQMAPFPGARNWPPATVVEHHKASRSYVVEYNGRKYRRNRQHLCLAIFKAQAESHQQHGTLPDVSLGLSSAPRNMQSPTPRAEPETAVPPPAAALSPKLILETNSVPRRHPFQPVQRQHAMAEL